MSRDYDPYSTLGEPHAADTIWAIARDALAVAGIAARCTVDRDEHTFRVLFDTVGADGVVYDRAVRFSRDAERTLIVELVAKALRRLRRDMQPPV